MLVEFLLTIFVVCGFLFVGHFFFEKMRQQDEAKVKWNKRIEVIRRLHDDD